MRPLSANPPKALSDAPEAPVFMSPSEVLDWYEAPTVTPGAAR
jgi:hypothetical protein